MSLPRIVLAFDTAMAGCSAALLDIESGVCVAETVPMVRGQAERLVPMIEAAVEKAGKTFANIDVIGTTVGPGAFTGLRIGLSAARSFGLALDVPVIGLTTTAVLARQYGTTENLAVILETKRSDFYIQIEDGAPAALSGEEITVLLKGRKMTLIGDAIERFRETVTPEEGWRFVGGYDLPDPAVMARMAAEIYLAAPADKAFPAPAPLYLREADVSKPKRALREIRE